MKDNIIEMNLFDHLNQMQVVLGQALAALEDENEGRLKNALCRLKSMSADAAELTERW